MYDHALETAVLLLILIAIRLFARDRMNGGLGERQRHGLSRYSCISSLHGNFCNSAFYRRFCERSTIAHNRCNLPLSSEAIYETFSILFTRKLSQLNKCESARGLYLTIIDLSEPH
ncbi:hypothetical protein P5V15_000306 [Pogonomyrmex californicus]